MQELEVQGQIVQADAVTVETLVCHGSLTAERVTSGGDVTIHEKATCGLLESGGSVEVRGDPSGIKSLTWDPAKTGNRLEFQHPDAQIPLVSAGAAGGGAPELHLRDARAARYNSSTSKFPSSRSQLSKARPRRRGRGGQPSACT